MDARLDYLGTGVEAMVAAMVAAMASRLLSLGLAFLHAFFRTDWLRFIASPSVAAGAMAVLPAAWLVIRESVWPARSPWSATPA
jgi:hypothetical protein